MRPQKNVVRFGRFTLAYGTDAAAELLALAELPKDAVGDVT